jgi:hypothetical protein
MGEGGGWRPPAAHQQTPALSLINRLETQVVGVFLFCPWLVHGPSLLLDPSSPKRPCNNNHSVGLTKHVHGCHPISYPGLLPELPLGDLLPHFQDNPAGLTPTTTNICATRKSDSLGLGLIASTPAQAPGSPCEEPPHLYNANLT